MTQKKSFWATLPGVLAGIASVLSAAGIFFYYYHGGNAPPSVPRIKEVGKPLHYDAKGPSNNISTTPEAPEPGPKITYPESVRPITGQEVTPKPTADSTIKPKPSDPQTSRENFQKLNARVVKLRFFKSEDKTVPPPDKRVYSERFELSQVRSRFICWELDLAFPETTEASKFDLETTWYDPYNNVKQIGFTKFTIPVGRKIFWPSSGRMITDDWVQGTYRVVLKIADKEVASGNFKLVTGN